MSHYVIISIMQYVIVSLLSARHDVSLSSLWVVCAVHGHALRSAARFDFPQTVWRRCCKFDALYDGQRRICDRKWNVRELYVIRSSSVFVYLVDRCRTAVKFTCVPAINSVYLDFSPNVQISVRAKPAKSGKYFATAILLFSCTISSQCKNFVEKY